jgi:hypothetical protein
LKENLAGRVVTEMGEGVWEEKKGYERRRMGMGGEEGVWEEIK